MANPEEIKNSYIDFVLTNGEPPKSVYNFAKKLKITEADFSGWVEERGHGFASTWDPRYTALTEMHDENQDPQKGGLLYAKYGNGYYIYMSYAFFRQIPEGVPGSYRIFANLLSAGKNAQLKAKATTSTTKKK